MTYVCDVVSPLTPGKNFFKNGERPCGRLERGATIRVQAVVEAFGKNEQVMKVIWALSMAIIGLVITKVLDPGMAQQVVGVLTTGGL